MVNSSQMFVCPKKEIDMFLQKIKKIDELQKEIQSFRPLNKQELSELKEYYKIGLTYTSNALEGNSLTETETKIVLEEGITIGGKLIKDHLEAIGSGDAYELLYKLARHEYISEKDILNLHKLFYVRINPKFAGKYRKVQVFITGSDYIPPVAKDIPFFMRKFIESLPHLKKDNHPVKYAALMHLQLVAIHPFTDGNGRCARLLMNLALMQAGYPITIIPPILRTDYINAIKRAQMKKDDSQFIEFICSMVYESQLDYLRMLRALVQ